MQYNESIFWAMAIGVLWALAGGWLMGRFAHVGRTLGGVAFQALIMAGGVAYFATRAGAGHMVALLAIATFMFSMVIGTAAALLARRVRRERRVLLP